MRLMILEDKKLRSTLRANAGIVSIGSNPECAVHLPDPRIGGHQATIVQDPGGDWWLEIVDTSAPTCLNRAVQKGRARLRHADEIEMGPFAIRLFMESGKSPEELQRERMVALARKHDESLPLSTVAKKFDSPVAVSKEHLEQMTLLALRLAQFESAKDLLAPILRAMIRTFGARRGWVGIRSEDHGPFEFSLGVTEHGQPCDRPTFSELMQPRCLNGTQYLYCPEASAPDLRSAMAVPLICQSGTLGMLYVENDAGDPAFDEASYDAFCTLACCVAMPVETVIRKSLARRQVAAGTELTIARSTQDAVTPKALPQWNELYVAGYRLMGTERCCDYYDIVQLPDKTASLIMARIEAEGVAVPRVLAEVRTAFRSSALHVDAPHLFARALNWLLSAGEGRVAVDLVQLWIAPATGKVSYTVAGSGVHLARVGADGEFHWIEEARVESIGKAKAVAAELATFDLGHGESLVMATDGVNKAANAKGEAYQLPGLEDSLCEGLSRAPGQALAELGTDLAEFLKGGASPDDLTVVLVRRA
jgi:DNA-binding transcriptional regulator YdaS (Cro superfamily)